MRLRSRFVVIGPSEGLVGLVAAFQSWHPAKKSSYLHFVYTRDAKIPSHICRSVTVTDISYTYKIYQLRLNILYRAIARRRKLTFESNHRIGFTFFIVRFISYYQPTENLYVVCKGSYDLNSNTII